MATVFSKKGAPMGLKFPAVEGKSKAVDLTLHPGPNVVKDSDWAEAKKHEMTKLHLEHGHLVEGDGDAKSKKEEKPAK